MSRRTRAFSLAELILSLGFIAVVILAVLALGVTVLRVDSKSLETSAGSLVADRLVARTVAGLRSDSPAGSKAQFLARDAAGDPWRRGEVQDHRTVFYYTLHVRSVKDAAGDPLGQAAVGNRLKKLDVHVWWAGERRTGREGFGQLEVRTTVLINEAELVDDSDAR